MGTERRAKATGALKRRTRRTEMLIGNILTPLPFGYFWRPGSPCFPPGFVPQTGTAFQIWIKSNVVEIIGVTGVLLIGKR
jgi:hypothetical protein